MRDKISEEQLNMQTKGGQVDAIDTPDLLRMEYINSLPQPFIAIMIGGGEWPVYDIDVETGLLRIDVVGKLQVMHIRDVNEFQDADGCVYDSDSFYCDYIDT